MSWLRDLPIWLPLAGFAGVIFYLAAIPQGGALGIAVRLIGASAATLALIELALVCFLFRDWGDASFQFDPPRRGKEVVVNHLLSVVYWVGPIGMGILFILAAALFVRALLEEYRWIVLLLRWRRRGVGSPSAHS